MIPTIGRLRPCPSLHGPAIMPAQEISPMTKYFRIGLTAALLAGAAVPAFAQAPAPAPNTQAAPDAATPAPAKTKHHVRKHHAVAQKKPAADTAKDPAPAN
jgi:hypothetical protein